MYTGEGAQCIFFESIADVHQALEKLAKTLERKLFFF